jgi:hypothetical protein
MKHFRRSIVACVGFVQIVSSSNAQPARSPAQLNAVVKTDLEECSARRGAIRPTPIIPTSSAQAFRLDRIENTLNGVWRGRVSGAYPRRFIAKDGYLDVDYYWIIDVKRGESLVIEQLSPRRTARRPPRGAPAWSFLMCGEDQYLPRGPRQIHEFQKVSANVEDARPILEKSTGLTFNVGVGESMLSAFWKGLVDQKYFDTQRFGAYAGGLFKPFAIEPVVGAAGNTLISMRFEAEYRGSGATAAKFETGMPILGVESVQFLGVTTRSGDYLVASIGNGLAWRKEAAGVINMSMDKVVLGPLLK